MSLIQRKSRRKLSVGNMRDRIILKSRALQEPAFGFTQASEKFEDSVGPLWALVETKTGKVIFDGVNKDVAITHQIYIRHDPQVTDETWVELEDGRLLDITTFDDFEERKEYMVLFCTERGPKTSEGSHA